MRQSKGFAGLTIVMCFTIGYEMFGRLLAINEILTKVIACIVGIYILMTLYALLLASRKKRRKLVEKALGRIVNCMIASTALMCISIIGIDLWNEYGATTPDVSKIMFDKQIDDLDIDDEFMKLIQTDNYKSLSLQEKTDLLYQLTVYECKNLGIDVPTLSVKKGRDNLYGSYNDEENDIMINEKYIDDIEQMVITISHEVYHSYEYRCIQSFSSNSELLWARQVRGWKEEFEEGEKVNTSKDFEDYYTKTIESDARKYAQDRFYEIYYFCIHMGDDVSYTTSQ